MADDPERPPSIAPTSIHTVQAESAPRDEKGRFLTGNTGGGRTKGSRNRLTETFLEIVAKDFAEHGKGVLERVRNEDPVTYVRVMASLIPRELIAKRDQEPELDYAELSYEEIQQLYETEKRRALVKNVLSDAGRNR